MSALLDAASFICLVSGAIFCAIGGLGILRLPDLYTRTHAATITDTLGAALVLMGLMIEGGLSNVTVKLVMVLMFVYFTSPVAGHALVKAAFASGLRAQLTPEQPPHPPTSTAPEPAAITTSGAPRAANEAKRPPEGGDGDDAA